VQYPVEVLIATDKWYAESETTLIASDDVTGLLAPEPSDALLQALEATLISPWRTKMRRSFPWRIREERPPLARPAANGTTQRYR
jgi:hypothetical protein